MPRASAVLASVAAAALLATIGSPAHADVYSNESTANGALVGIDPEGAATLSGEVFTAPGGTLQSWTFSVANETGLSPGNVEFVIALWTGDPTTINSTFTIGDALYASAPVTAGSDSYTFSDLTFSGLDLTLTEGTTYIAYLTINGVSSPATLLAMGTSDTSGPIGDGWTETSPDMAHYYNVAQLTYSATFNIPEPGSMALVATGLIGLGLLRRRHG
jgi:hypothetical protein